MHIILSTYTYIHTHTQYMHMHVYKNMCVSLKDLNNKTGHKDCTLGLNVSCLKTMKCTISCNYMCISKHLNM